MKQVTLDSLIDKLTKLKVLHGGDCPVGYKGECSEYWFVRIVPADTKKAELADVSEDGRHFYFEHSYARDSPKSKTQILVLW